MAALLSTVLSVVGMWSIGRFVAPAALLLLGAAVSRQVFRSRTDAATDVTASPLAARDDVPKLLAGTCSAVLGGGLVYGDALAQDLFGACASETVTCAIDSIQWDALGLTLLGLLAMSLGGWLVWRQVALERALASMQIR